ncbi:MAG: tyrosine-type recombinase/integrase [Candidatus Brocadiae bacterium]|nr:tyrosine-type recombinase/integrase [Candidatus Brocadiia bacterium]
MARPRKQYPTPGKRNRRNSWCLYWRSGDRTYEVTLGGVDESSAESLRLQVALALRTGDWPEWALSRQPVHKYLSECVARNGGAALEEYEPSLRVEISPSWAGTSLAHIRELLSFANKTCESITPQDAQAFLDHIVQTSGPHFKNNGPRSKGTRNEALAACRRFYAWAGATGRLVINPFAKCRPLKKDDVETIVYCTREERDPLLAAANDSRDGIAVWLAFWTGMRRGELQRCHWEHISLANGRVVVPVSKTRRRRVVPLARKLLEKLEPVAKRKGKVVPWSDVFGQWTYQARMLLEALVERCPDIPQERIRWNSFRHTFGSLLAQDGVSLDKISAWMGNSSAVCRRHYAEFVPRDHRDEEIDRLE